jgi:radical SAM protein with 4Fe4S-binding SPASM domain
MCVIDFEKVNILGIDKLKIILNKFEPYKKDIKYVSFIGQGETLLDKQIIEKIGLTKNMGFKGIGFSTNCTELNEKISISLIKAGLDTIICSIDGLTKKTHESIRIGTNFENIILNVKNFIKIRNDLHLSTKIIIRFIYQNANKHEWEEFKKYWLSLLNRDLGDDVIKVDVHNYGGNLENFDKFSIKSSIPIQNRTCKNIFERIIILSTGNIIFCCGDIGQFPKIGNVFNDDPIEVYNNELYTKYRKYMIEGKILELENCKNCTII